MGEMLRWDVPLQTIFCVLLTLSCAKAKVDITNVKCEALDDTIIKFDYCSIKAVNRTFKYISGKAKLYKTVTNAMVNLAVFKKTNGYRPFLYNITVDGCKFLENRKHIVIGFFFDAVVNYWNINHTCPYDHDIILDKFPFYHLGSLADKVLPIPHGDYALHVTFSTDKKPIAALKLYTVIV